MTPPDDYRDEMLNRRLSDADVEALLSKRDPDDRSLRELAHRLAAFDPDRFEADHSNAAKFASEAAALARDGKTTKVAATAVPRGGLSLTPRLATAAVAALLFLGMTGVAAASDGAIPGDALYGVDRALEHIGIGDGGASERLHEAGGLVAEGRSAEALSLLAESVEGESGEAAAALARAAERLRDNENGSDNAQEVRQSLADLLDWMASTDAEGRDFGQGVAERARELGNGDRGNSSENPGGSDGNPGQGQGQGQGQGGGNSGGNSGSAPGRDK